MIIKNGHIFTDQGRFMQADIKLEGDRIVEIAPAGTLEGDEVIDAMRAVGDALPASLRETGSGGLAATPTARRLAERL